ncbi:MAG: FimV/HubP family polar landmark protein [Gammaproteobacteria bacterium]
MTRKLAFLAVSLAVIPTPATPVGLGNIELRSFLNQPLHAEVELLSISAEELLDLNVVLGSREAFATANLQRSPLLDNLRFEIIQKPGDKATIHVTSREPVREPFLDFLLQVDWPGGRLVREYTVLVDPPVLMPAPVPQVQIAVTETATGAAAKVEPPKQTAAVASPTPVEVPIEAIPTRPHTVVPGEYTTVAGDTLWTIARQLRPNRSIRPQQMILALQRHNPHAFYGNVNLLKVGVTLRVPGLEEITSLSRDSAAAEVDRQESEWRRQRSKPLAQQSADVSQEPGTSAQSSKTAGVKRAAKPMANTETAEVESRLKLVPPGPLDVELQVLAAGLGDSGGVRIEHLSKELALAVEAAETQRRASEVLRGRLTAVQTQMEEMRKLIAINEKELARFRNQLVAAQEGQGLVIQPAAPDVSESKSLTAEIGGIISSPVLKTLIGVVGILVMALLWVVMRQRKMEEEMSAPLADLPEQPGADTVVGVKAPQSEAVMDPIAEADVFIAYGRYDQAAELVEGALKQDPGQQNLLLKLLEIHYAAKHQAAFDAEAASLKASIDDEKDPIWTQVLLMGKTLSPENPLYSGREAKPVGEIVNEILDEIPTNESLPEVRDMPVVEDDNRDIEWDLNLKATGTDDQESDGGIVQAKTFEFEPELSDTVATEQTSSDLTLEETEDVVTEFTDLEFEPHNENSLTEGTTPEPAAEQQHGEQTVADQDLDMEIDEMGTKLDLGRAYIEMGDAENARGILDEVVAEGNEEQRQQAEALIQKMS